MVSLQTKAMLRTVLVVYFAAIVRFGQAEVYVTECYPNSTFKIENPGSYSTVFANNSVQICTTTWTTGKTHVYVNDCKIDEDILLFFSNLNADSNHVITGSAIVTVRCAEIPESGVTMSINVTANIGVGLNFTEYTSFGITSALYTNVSTLTAATEVMVGTPLFWVIQSEIDKFDLLPEECWAYGGMAVLDNVPKKYMLNNGCSLDEDLTSDFQWYNSTFGNMIWSVLYAFRFIGSEYITLQCDVRVCSRPLGACNITCPDKKRRRRAVNSAGEPSGRLTEDQAGEIHDSGTHRLVSSKIRVIEVLHTALSESASIESECIWLACVWLVLKIF